MEMHCYVYITLISCIRNKKVYIKKKNVGLSIFPIRTIRHIMRDGKPGDVDIIFNMFVVLFIFLTLTLVIFTVSVYYFINLCLIFLLF